MGAGLLLLVAGIYLAVAIDYAWDERYGMALAFVAYAISNAGFAWDLWQ